MRRRGSPVVAERRARGRRDKAATRGLWPGDPDSPRLKRSTASSRWEAAAEGRPACTASRPRPSPSSACSLRLGRSAREIVRAAGYGVGVVVAQASTTHPLTKGTAKQWLSTSTR